MTSKQIDFVDKFVESNDSIEATIYAGYSSKNAKSISKRLLNDEKILREIASRKFDTSDCKIAKEDEILEYLSEILRGKKNSEDDNQKGVSKKYDDKERMKAAELLGKRYGTFKEIVSGGELPKVIIYGEGDLPE